jgi:hypothetical protein
MAQTKSVQGFNTTASGSRRKKPRFAGSITTTMLRGAWPPVTIDLKLRKETTMLRVILLLALLCACKTAFAQELTAEQRSACMGDYQKFCKGTVPGGGRIIACLAKSNDKLTAECQKVLADAQKK